MFLTVDRNLSFQQSVGKFKIAVVVMVAKGNRHADLVHLIPKVPVTLGSAHSNAIISPHRSAVSPLDTLRDSVEHPHGSIMPASWDVRTGKFSGS